jgi:hypothetical protein
MSSSSVTSTVEHNPLGWPAGSIRGLLSLLIAAQFWLLLMLPESKKVPIPLTLYLMLTLVGMFLVSHGKSIATRSDPAPSPLGLPGGTLRLLIIGGTIAVIGYLYTNEPERLMQRLRPSEAQIQYWPDIIVAFVGGFFLGYLTRIMPFRRNWFFQAILAWTAMIAMGLLVVEIFIRAFIDPTLKEKLDLHLWGVVVTAIVSCYFGARS